MTIHSTLKARLAELEQRQGIIVREILIALLLAACTYLGFYAHSATKLLEQRVANDCLTHGKITIDGMALYCGRTK